MAGPANTGADGRGRVPPWKTARIRWFDGGFLLAYHVGALLVFLVGFSWPALVAFLVVYWTQIFGVSAGYHRYFAHRSYKTSRVFQFLLAVLGGLAAQMGPLWWASHHRRHHRYPDREGDVHSPVLYGFLWSHIGWILSEETKHTDWEYVKDWAAHPELRWLDRRHILIPGALLVVLYGVGSWLGAVRPGWGTSGLQMLVWGGFLSTALCFQVTFCVNSLTHIVGSRRFETRDNSRNVGLLALLTNGEGWHNNHHRFPASERQGFYWWEWDLTHYILKVLEKLRVVWGIKGPPARIYS